MDCMLDVVELLCFDGNRQSSKSLSTKGLRISDAIRSKLLDFPHPICSAILSFTQSVYSRARKKENTFVNEQPTAYLWITVLSFGLD
jgi:hypothetical protein